MPIVLATSRLLTLSNSFKNIESLIRLLDDPDEEIYSHVRKELWSLGTEVIPNLENMWENQRLGNLYESRIETLIHELHLSALKGHLVEWWKKDTPDLLEGLTLVSNYKYPNLEIEDLNSQISDLTQEMYDSVFDYHTALEKVQIINHFIYDEHQFKGNKSGFHETENSILKDVLDRKKGNPLSLAILYILIGRQLDLPIYGVNLPRHFVVAFLDPYHITQPLEDSPVLFYINTFSNGEVFGKEQLEDFLEKINVAPKPNYFKPCNAKEILKRTLNNLMYSYTKSDEVAKAEEIKDLINLLT